MRSPARSLPYGTMAGIMTLIIAATLTWYVCSGLIPWEYLGQAGTPLFDAARVTGSTSLMVLLFIGTIFSTLASANGCINDASRAWFSMGRDRYLPIWFGAVHPSYPHAVPVDRLPGADRAHLRARRAARPGHHLLDPLGPARLHLHDLQHDHVPAEVAARHRSSAAMSTRSIRSRHCCCWCCARATYFAVFLGYGTQLIAMMCFYIVASLWFHFWRYRFVRRGDQFTMPWRRPAGY